MAERKCILLTGCAGFIGSNFLKMVLNDEEISSNYKFIVVDALTYSGFYGTIEKDISESDTAFFEIDLRDTQAVINLFDEKSIDGVIHFAAESHVDRSIDNPNIFVETNVLGTMNLLNEALKIYKKTNKFTYLQISTDEVYGDLREGDPAFSELHNLKPSSPYSASKTAADCLVNSYYKTFNLPTIITRCSNNYGPYQFPEKLIPLMVNSAFKNIKLPVYGDGKNIRDWIYVDDHNRGIWECFTKGVFGEVYNLGGDAEKRNIEIVKTIIDRTGRDESLIEYVPDRLGHDYRYAMNFEKINKALGWSPKYSFEEGMDKTIKWYRDNTDWTSAVIKRG